MWWNSDRDVVSNYRRKTSPDRRGNGTCFCAQRGGTNSLPVYWGVFESLSGRIRRLGSLSDT